VHILSTALTFAGAGGFGLAAGLVLDYLGLLGASQDRSPGQLVLAALILLASGLLFWMGKRLRWRSHAVAQPQATTRAWDPRESLLLVVPLGAVLAAADAIGDWALGERAGAWVRFAAVSAVGAIVGGLYGARSSLGAVDPATRRLSTSLATSAALVGVVVAGWIGVQARALTMGVFGGFFLAWVTVRAWRALEHRRVRRR
jgi:hypothetical protein